MYAAGGGHPNREPSLRLLERVQSGEIEGCSSTEVLQEILYRYSALGRIDLGAEVYDLFVRICPVIFDVTVADTDTARNLLLEVEWISARDAVHVAVMKSHGVEAVATFDTGFDGLPGVERMDLS